MDHGGLDAPFVLCLAPHCPSLGSMYICTLVAQNLEKPITAPTSCFPPCHPFFYMVLSHQSSWILYLLAILLRHQQVRRFGHFKAQEVSLNTQITTCPKLPKSFLGHACVYLYNSTQVTTGTGIGSTCFVGAKCHMPCSNSGRDVPGSRPRPYMPMGMSFSRAPVVALVFQGTPQRQPQFRGAKVFSHAHMRNWQTITSSPLLVWGGHGRPSCQQSGNPTGSRFDRMLSAGCPCLSPPKKNRSAISFGRRTHSW